MGDKISNMTRVLTPNYTRLERQNTDKNQGTGKTSQQRDYNIMNMYSFYVQWYIFVNLYKFKISLHFPTPSWIFFTFPCLSSRGRQSFLKPESNRWRDEWWTNSPRTSWSADESCDGRNDSSTSNFYSETRRNCSSMYIIEIIQQLSSLSKQYR